MDARNHYFFQMSICFVKIWDNRALFFPFALGLPREALEVFQETAQFSGGGGRGTPQVGVGGWDAPSSAWPKIGARWKGSKEIRRTQFCGLGCTRLDPTFSRRRHIPQHCGPSAVCTERGFWVAAVVLPISLNAAPTPFRTQSGERTFTPNKNTRRNFWNLIFGRAPLANLPPPPRFVGSLGCWGQCMSQAGGMAGGRVG